MATVLTTRSDWLAANPPVPGRLTATLGAVARAVGAGEDFRHAVREFLDEFALHGDDRAPAASIPDMGYGDRLDPAARFFVEEVLDRR